MAKNIKDDVVSLFVQHKMPAQTHYLVQVMATLDGMTFRDKANTILTEYCTEYLDKAGILQFYKRRFERAAQNRGTYNGAEWDDNLVYELPNGVPVIPSRAQNEAEDDESELVKEIEGITE